MTGTRLLTWAVRLHPAPYRAEFGPELVEAALASMAGRPRAGVLLEAAQLAAHGLRLRLRLGADQPLGRAAADAAPAVLALAAAGQVTARVFEARVFGPAVSSDHPARVMGGYPVWAAVGLTVLALFALLAGRVTAARALGSAAPVAAVLSVVLAVHRAPGQLGAPTADLLNPVLAGLFLWLAPLRLAPVPSGRTALGALAAGAAAGGVILAVPGRPPWGLVDVALLLTVALVSARTRHASRTALVALLPLYPVALDQLAPHSPATTPTLQSGLVIAAVTTVVLRLRRRTGRAS